MDGIGQIAAVCFVMLLLAGSVWLLRAKGFAAFNALQPRKRNGVLELIERLPLSAHHGIYLVRYRDRELLVAVSGATCNILDATTPAVSK